MTQPVVCRSAHEMVSYDIQVLKNLKEEWLKESKCKCVVEKLRKNEIVINMLITYKGDIDDSRTKEWQLYEYIDFIEVAIRDIEDYKDVHFSNEGY